MSDLKTLEIIDQNGMTQHLRIMDAVALDNEPITDQGAVKETIEQLRDQQIELNAKVEALADAFGLIEQPI